MSFRNFRFRALMALVLMTASFLAGSVPAQGEASSGSTASPALAAEERESCTRNLKIIYDAVQAYQYDHKDLPNWLSDLVPDYISDPNVLICPVCRRTGKAETGPLADPKLACSYLFEFSPVPVGPTIAGQPRHTRREWKRRQMGMVGSAVPLVRCRNHDPILNLGFNGTIYASPAQWELMFTNRVNPAELSVSALFGGEDPPEEAPIPAVNNNPPARVPVIRDTAIRTLDLSRFYNAPLDRSWLGAPGDDLSNLPRGVQSFGGIEFDVRGVVLLKGGIESLAKFPARINGIPVHHHCQHIYFLHAANSGSAADEGQQIGAYVVHLPNSTASLEIPIYYGRSVRNWHPEPGEPAPDKELKIAWSGENPASQQNGRSVRLFVTAWNLAPGVDIDSLDFVSAGKTAAPFLLAISVD